MVCALVRMAVRLPEHHQDQDSKDVVKLVMGLIATISALVLLSTPYSGLLRLSDTPLRNALVQLGR